MTFKSLIAFVATGLSMLGICSPVFSSELSGIYPTIRAVDAIVASETEDQAVMRESEAIRLALENSRQISTESTRVQIAESRLNSAGMVRNPELRISEISTKYFTDEFDELELGLRWRPPNLGELGERKQRWKVRLWEQKVEEKRTRDRLILRVRRRYATVIMLDELIELTTRREEMEKKRIELIEGMMDMGQRSIVYFTKSKLWLTESRNEYSRIVQWRNSTRLRLARLTNSSATVKVFKEELPVIDMSFDRLLKIANENRPEVGLVSERKELARAQYDLERFKLIPWFSYIELSYHLENNKPDSGELKLGIELPLFDWNRGNITATRMAIERREGQTGAIEERIEYEVQDSYSLYNDALLDWNLTQSDSQEFIDTARKVIETSKAHNTILPDEVYELERSIVETEKLLSEKRRNLAHALYELFFALGVEDAEAIFGAATNE